MKECYLLPAKNVVVVYIHVPHDINHIHFAKRFVESYEKNPPGYHHQTIVVCNGSPPVNGTKKLFDGLPNLQFIEHDDSGWDIGGYQKAAREVPADLMVFLGGTSRPHGKGWLARMVDAYQKRGEALYGTMGNRGDGRVNVWPHVRTTGFFMNPELLNRYPMRVTYNEQRYEFEHGRTCLANWVVDQGLKVWVVAWDGEYEWANWDVIPNGFHRGDQSNLLVKDRLTDPPFWRE